MKLSNRSLINSSDAQGGIVYGLIITFVAIFVYACIYPAFKQILMMSMSGMGDVEALIITAIPFFILIAVLWSIIYVIHPRQQQ